MEEYITRYDYFNKGQPCVECHRQLSVRFIDFDGAEVWAPQCKDCIDCCPCCQEPMSKDYQKLMSEAVHKVKMPNLDGICAVCANYNGKFVKAVVRANKFEDHIQHWTQKLKDFPDDNLLEAHLKAYIMLSFEGTREQRISFLRDNVMYHCSLILEPRQKRHATKLLKNIEKHGPNGDRDVGFFVWMLNTIGPIKKSKF